MACIPQTITRTAIARQAQPFLVIFFDAHGKDTTQQRLLNK